jgi:hypothetical protein
MRNYPFNDGVFYIADFTEIERRLRMRRDAELESLATRLANRAGSPLLRDQPEMQSDMRAAADVVRDYIAVLRATGKGAWGRDIGQKLAELLCPGGRTGA